MRQTKTAYTYIQISCFMTFFNVTSGESVKKTVIFFAPYLSKIINILTVLR
jgi:hypothetical protein